MRKKVYQKFIIGCQNPYEALENGLGGVIFFTRDIENEKSLREKIRKIKSAAAIPPFISIDEEGGRVERTENLRPRRLSPRFAFQKGEDFLKKQSGEISSELAKWGFNLNFAPCADVNTNPDNPIIGERSFSSFPDEVIRGVKIFCDESEKYGVIPCVKHYPGHGDADKDSHLTLPVINLSMQEMENVHIKPFRKAIENGVGMVMAAHLHCPCFDKTPIPASLSTNAIGYLRNNLGFDGVVITDDMVMKGVQDFGTLEACIMAINAGVDMFIFRDSDDKTLDLIEKLADIVQKTPQLKEKIEISYERIIRLKQKYNLISA